MLRRRLSLGVYPALALSVLLLLSWLVAVFYASTAVPLEEDPFTGVWLEFTPEGSAQILTVAVLGLLMSAILPTWGSGRTYLKASVGAQLRSRTGLWFMCASGALIMLVLAKGGYLWEADAYLKFQGPQALASLSNLAAPVGILSAGLLCSQRPIAGCVLGLLIVACLFGYGTRLLALAPLIFLLGLALAGRRVPWLAWVAAGVLAYLLLPVALQARNLGEHGILPYFTYFVGRAGEDTLPDAMDLAANFGFTAAIAEYTAVAVPKIPVAGFHASLNPGWSGAAGWDQWGPELRAHLYIPYSMIGEFANAGMWALFIAMLVWGLLCRLCINVTLTNSTPLGRLLLVAVLGLIAISGLYILQYNTRSVSRIMTIMVALTVLALIHGHLTSRRNVAEIVRIDAR